MPAATLADGQWAAFSGIAFDPAGDIVATDRIGTSSYVVSTFVPPFTSTAKPSSIIVNPTIVTANALMLDCTENLYVADTVFDTPLNVASNLVVFTPPYSGTPIVTAPVGGANYVGLAATSRQLFACSSVGQQPGRIDVYTLPISGTSVPAFSITTGFLYAQSIAVDAAGTLYVASPGTGTVVVYTPPFSASSTPSASLKTGIGSTNVPTLGAVGT